jgi:NhaP-type Na+/H+ or K+/H+ antiporter
METFQIKASSWVIYFITFSFIMAFGAILSLQIIPRNNNKTVDVILFVVLLAFSIFVTRFAGIAMTHWTITNKNIHLKWVGQFIFTKGQI